MAVNNNADDYAAARLGVYFAGFPANLTGQCVSLGKWYLGEMCGVGDWQAARGNAKDVGDTLVRQGLAVEVSPSDRRRGDIIIWPQDGGGLGHEGVLLSNDQVFEENVGIRGNPSEIVDGIRVYASRTDSLDAPWRVGSPRFYRPLGYIEVNPAPAPVVEPTPSNGQFTVITDIPGYINAANAASHENQVDMVHPGDYSVFNQSNGMVNVTTNPSVPGSWINPADNVAAAPVPQGDYAIVRDVPGFIDSAHAASHTDQATTVTAGNYFVFNQYNGMINVTLKQGVPGSWINPSDNVIDQPAPQAPVAPEPIPVTPPVQPKVAYTKLAVSMDLILNRDDYLTDVESGSALHDLLSKGTPFKAFGRAQHTDGSGAYFMTEDNFGDADTRGTPVHPFGINTVSLSPAPPQQGDSEKIPVKVSTWQSTYISFLSPQEYVAQVNVEVHEINVESTQSHAPTVQLMRNQGVKVAGTFSRNGVKYYRTVNSVANGYWYGIPENALVKSGEDAFDEMLAEIGNEVRRDIDAAKSGEKTTVKKIMDILHRKK